ncbi:Rrf2 family transcriptional regulator [Anaerotruncus sp. 1XD42-93]|uniref:RrF2 family transcriptional regulator n=1 Tax=Anaerotruncus sp. 1XD42-93 TaxID=2320853 RepID=UPI000EA33775|nr:Rrf2 family transcriptional regulator [Anaerotruncus sp. 1XD42-93]NBK17682.1 Rrf2 family transcriptional regulator [Anaerotruncus sp. 1XD42-93]NBK17812.1 Rrf2 family transcriptional regulator [Anaerotruncus sp. 1XD42-93]RKJ88859.1 Rrf2 family transcriptional regulator [Anaerotruncus sp. 1XD22-93]RKJ93766.1 Rrf2 family transcriptional regulator [Anaerotruncus sp. 1XD22-93]
MHISTKCSVAIHCLVFICEYGESKKVTSELLSLSTGVNPVTIRNIVSALKKDGILSVKFGTGGTTLNCSLDEITLYRICNAIEPDFLNKLIGIHASPSCLCPVGRSIHGVLDSSYQNVREDLQKSLQNISMEEIMDKYHQQTENT